MIDDSIERVRVFLRQRGRTKKALCEKAELHPNTLLNVEEPKWNPSTETLRKLEEAITEIEGAAA